MFLPPCIGPHTYRAPSSALQLYFQDDLTHVRSWYINGKHYQRTSEHWLKAQDRRAKTGLPALEKDAVAKGFAPEEARKAFAVFDKDNNGDISRAEIKTTLMKVYKERRFLSRSMRDVGQALSTLNSMLLILAIVAIFV